MRVALLVLAAGTVLLTGCQEEPRAMAFFQENDAEREKVIAACEDGSQTGEECTNALEAQKRVDFSNDSEDRQKLYESWGR